MSQQIQPSGFSTGHDGSFFDYDGRLTEVDFDNLLLWASDNGASDIKLQTEYPVIAEIGGKQVRITRRAVTQSELENATRYVYGDTGPGDVKAGHDIDWAHETKRPDGTVGRFRLNITNGRSEGGPGFQLVARSLPTMPPLITEERMRCEPEIIANFRPENGIVLVTGPTGSGKSTLLSSGIRWLLENPDRNESICEYSKPVEYVYDGVQKHNNIIHQVDVGKDLKPRDLEGEASLWGYCVRNGMRRKPSIILIGEARDKATIEGSMEASLTGHLCMSTMHTIGVAETIRRSLIPFPAEERASAALDLMEAMRMVVTQRLLPRIGGGKVACREYMVFDEEARMTLLDLDYNAWPQKIRSMLQNKDVVGRTMADCAKALLEEGLITPETYQAVARRRASAV